MMENLDKLEQRFEYLLRKHCASRANQMMIRLIISHVVQISGPRWQRFQAGRASTWRSLCFEWRDFVHPV